MILLFIRFYLSQVIFSAVYILQQMNQSMNSVVFAISVIRFTSIMCVI